jgi:hypothetical protein
LQQSAEAIVAIVKGGRAATGLLKKGKFRLAVIIACGLVSSSIAIMALA